MSIISISGQKAKKMIDNNEFDLIIDVRDEEAYEEQRIAGAINIPMNEINDKIEFLEKYNSRKILIYCYEGYKSTAAAKILAIYGFKKIYTLNKGIDGYKL